jgi:hypothetical protein
MTIRGTSLLRVADTSAERDILSLAVCFFFRSRSLVIINWAIKKSERETTLLRATAYSDDFGLLLRLVSINN